MAGFSEVRVVELESQENPMQVFGLPGHIIRNARGASRLLAAQTPTIEAARRRDALARWRKAMAQGLTSEQAARAVGFPRSTLYRWRKRAEPLSRRPRRLRQPRRPEGLAGAVERLRLDHPMWGKEKLGRDCQESCVRGRVSHHALTNLSSNMMANWVLASHHSRGGIFHVCATWRKTRYSNLIAASSVGKCPLVRTARRSLAFKDSMAFV